MDELTMIRELLPEPAGPSPQVARDAWESLDRRIHGRRPGRRQHRSRPLLTRPLVVGGLAAGVAVALAAGVLATGGGPTGTVHPGAGAGGAQTGRPAHAFLLAMATKAKQNRSAGRYRCTETVQATREMVGANDKVITAPWVYGPSSPPASAPAGYQYSIYQRNEDELCTESPLGPTTIVSTQYLGARPASPADAAVWRRDGSPRSWVIGNRQPPILPSQPGQRSWRGVTHSGCGLVPCGRPLPTDPAKLKAVLEAPSRKFSHGGAAALFATVAQLLNQPVSPAVHAAAYRVLAEIPGIRMKPDVTDPEGQTGTAVYFVVNSITTKIFGTDGYMLVDPATGWPLANVTLAHRQISGLPPGTVISYQAVIRSFWTNHLPKPPARPKGRPTASAPRG